jgi:1,2-dihydroxy-3-keto-5-methylthiopentene dioxygenase
MTRLTIYPDTEPGSPVIDTENSDVIIRELSAVGMRFERWQADREINADTGNEDIIAAYQNEIDRLVVEKGYQSWDVVSMHPEHPQKAEFRNKFLAEHTHSEDEVRFFVRGHGLFMVHAGDRVYGLLCEKDDLISVPANTKHWFDMGPNPEFTAIRLFNNPDGWVANFTGDEIASGFPSLDN